MALDRWIALFILLVCLAYGYGAFFLMDGSLPPFMRRNPIWPSTFPKILAVAGAAVALIILLGFEKAPEKGKAPEIDYRRLGDYKLGQALGLLAMMVAYALLLRSLGFIAATVLFLVGSAMLLGERRFLVLIPTACIAAGVVWYLVQEMLDIFLRPLPVWL
ncbi:MAG: tripartite tricarboxylate transporter TctB family protein [Pseudomonadota bacterium]